MRTAALLLSLILTLYTSPCNAQGRQQARGKEYNVQDAVNSGGVQRTYRLHVPPSYNRAKPMPVVFVFHGLGGTGGLMEMLTQFDRMADQKNFMVVYPDGLGHRWEAGNGRGQDVQFVQDILTRLSTIVNIDRRHIYAVGYSNGGHFVQYLACVTNNFAAIGAVGAIMMDAAAAQCGSNRVPIILFIGTDDPLAPSSDASHSADLGKLGDALGLSGLGSLGVGTAKMGGLMSAEETVDFWTRHNQVSSSPYTQRMPDTDSHDGTHVTRMTYGSYSGEVVYYRIEGGGHTWPGATYNGPSDIIGRVSHDIDATELLWDFFSHH